MRPNLVVLNSVTLIRRQFVRHALLCIIVGLVVVIVVVVILIGHFYSALLSDEPIAKALRYDP